MVDRLDALMGKETNGKTWWTKIGAAFRNRSGSGWTLVLDAMPAPIDGQYRISLFEPNNNNSGGSNNNNDRGGNSSGNNSSSSSGRPGSNRNEIPDDDSIPF
jgi:hypothetical protein